MTECNGDKFVTNIQTILPFLSLFSRRFSRGPIAFCNKFCNVIRKGFGLTDGNLSLESGPIN